MRLRACGSVICGGHGNGSRMWVDVFVAMCLVEARGWKQLVADWWARL